MTTEIARTPDPTALPRSARPHRPRSGVVIQSVNRYFDSHYRVTPTTNCWVWTEAPRDNGRVEIELRPGLWVAAYRYAYQRFVGPLAKNQGLHATCRNNMCVNPEHRKIVPVTIPTEPARITARDLAARLSSKL